MIWKMNLMLKEYKENDDNVLLETIESPNETYYVIYEKAKDTFSFQTTKKNALSTFKSFIKEYPFLSGSIMALGMHAIDSYKGSKRLVTRFFAQTAVERKLYKKIADDLVGTGHYTLVKTKRIKGGTLYELKRDRL